MSTPVRPGASIHEILLPAPIETVWAVAGDLEVELGHWLPDIRRFEITQREGDRLAARLIGRSGLRARFDIVLRPGWCLMQSRYLVGGMAAAGDDAETRFAFFGGVRGPLRLIDPALRPVRRRIAERALRRFSRRVERRS